MLMEKLEILGTGESLESVLSRFVPWAPDRYATEDERHFECLFPLVGYWNNYFHWTLMQLPRVRGLQHYRQITGADPTVAIRADAPEWLIESLELVGIDFERCHPWQTSYATADRIVLPSSRNKWADDYYPSRADCRWLRERVLENVQDRSVKTNFAERVYVSRADAATRRVNNRTALTNHLASLGFTEYVLSDLSVAEQAALFNNSEIVVGPHGAGLSNMVYASDATIVEILPETVVRPVFYYLANEVGLEYEFLISETANGQNDLTVDVQSVVSLVQQHL
jgi:capsular polysaccharide biosynthesis protein